jgi:hypothetical protein
VKQLAKKSKHAEVIKEFIEASWSGVQTRLAIKAYVHNVKILQRSARACLKFWHHVRRDIFMPTLWEIETRILAEVAKVPEAILKSEIEMHRVAWDSARRREEAVELLLVREKACKGMVRISTMPKDAKATFKHIEKVTQMIKRGKRDSRVLDMASSRNHLHGRSDLGMRAATSHPAMSEVDKHRLHPNVRRKIIQALIKESVTAWWQQYQDYKINRALLQHEWKKWFQAAVQVGPYRRHMWPEKPGEFDMPAFLTTVDYEALIRDMVVAELAQVCSIASQAGPNLNTHGAGLATMPRASVREMAP